MTQKDRERYRRIRRIASSSQGYEKRVAAKMFEKITPSTDGHWYWTGSVHEATGLPILNLWDDDGRMACTMPGRWVLKNLCDGDFGRAFQVASFCGERTCVCPSHLVVTTIGGLAKQRVLVLGNE